MPTAECYRRKRSEFEPAYLTLYRSGELAQRVERGLERLADCTLCPRDCHIDRRANRFAVCKTGRHAVVGSWFPHSGEEDCLRGWNGSGTIFFSWCNLRCVFCQNYDLSWQGEGAGTQPGELAEMMLRLEERGCHNINFVTPEHVVPQILEALPLAIAGGLRLPLVYNTSAYDSLDSIALMDGVIDIYMPDFKFSDPELARRYLRAPNYPEAARQAIRAMHRQVGDLLTDENGLALRGLILRHLVMPGHVDDTREILAWAARELGPETYVNLMRQYFPAGKVSAQEYVEINRDISRQEFSAAMAAARAAGLARLDAPAGRTLRSL
jgi:putative pyruvate formate lyase activating enzyme